MSNEPYILISKLCTHYTVETSFLYSLKDHDLLEIVSIESDDYLHHDSLPKFEKLLRMSQDLDLNMSGLEVVSELLNRIEILQQELIATRNKLEMLDL